MQTSRGSLLQGTLQPTKSRYFRGFVTGNAAVKASGFPEPFLQSLREISERQGPIISFRVGQAPNVGKGYPVSFKPMSVKTKTTNDAMGMPFAAGFIPIRQDLFGRVGSKPISHQDIIQHGKSHLQIRLSEFEEGVREGKYYQVSQARNRIRFKIAHTNEDVAANPDAIRDSTFYLELPAHPGDLCRITFQAPGDDCEHPFYVLGEDPMTGDADAFAIMPPLEVMESENGIPMNINQANTFELLKLEQAFGEFLHKHLMHGRETNDYDLLYDMGQFNSFKDSLQLPGLISPYEFFISYAANVKTAQNPEADYLQSMIQHGPETNNPGEPSPLDAPLIHVYKGEYILTRNEDELIAFLMMDEGEGSVLKNYFLRVHYGWPMEKWHAVVSKQVALGQQEYIDDKTLAAYSAYMVSQGLIFPSEYKQPSLVMLAKEKKRKMDLSDIIDLSKKLIKEVKLSCFIAEGQLPQYAVTQLPDCLDALSHEAYFSLVVENHAALHQLGYYQAKLHNIQTNAEEVLKENDCPRKQKNAFSNIAEEATSLGAALEIQKATLREDRTKLFTKKTHYLDQFNNSKIVLAATSSDLEREVLPILKSKASESYDKARAIIDILTKIQGHIQAIESWKALNVKVSQAFSEEPALDDLSIEAMSEQVSQLEEQLHVLIDEESIEVQLRDSANAYQALEEKLQRNIAMIEKLMPLYAVSSDVLRGFDQLSNLQEDFNGAKEEVNQTIEVLGSLNAYHRESEQKEVLTRYRMLQEKLQRYQSWCEEAQSEKEALKNNQPISYDINYVLQLDIPALAQLIVANNVRFNQTNITNARLEVLQRLKHLPILPEQIGEKLRSWGMELSDAQMYLAYYGSSLREPMVVRQKRIQANEHEAVDVWLQRTLEEKASLPEEKNDDFGVTTWRSVKNEAQKTSEDTVIRAFESNAYYDVNDRFKTRGHWIIQAAKSVLEESDVPGKSARFQRLEALLEEYLEKIASTCHISATHMRFSTDEERAVAKKIFKPRMEQARKLLTQLVTASALLIAPDDRSPKEVVKCIQQKESQLIGQGGRANAVHLVDISGVGHFIDAHRVVGRLTPAQLYRREQWKRVHGESGYVVDVSNPEYTNPSSVRDTEGLSNFLESSLSVQDADGSVNVLYKGYRSTSLSQFYAKAENESERRLRSQMMATRNVKQLLTQLARDHMAKHASYDSKETITLSLSALSLVSSSFLEHHKKGDHKAENEVFMIEEAMLAINSYDGRKVTLNVDGVTVKAKVDAQFMSIGANFAQCFPGGSGAKGVFNHKSISREKLTMRKGFHRFSQSVLHHALKVLPKASRRHEVYALKSFVERALENTQVAVLRRRVAVTKRHLQLDQLYAKLQVTGRHYEDLRTQTSPESAEVLQSVMDQYEHIRKQIMRAEKTLHGLYKKLYEVEKSAFLDQHLEWKQCLQALEGRPSLSEDECEFIEVMRLFYDAQKLYYTKGLLGITDYNAGEYRFELQAKVALLNYKTGRTTDMFCKSGEDRTGRVDNVVKELLMYKNRYGSFPPMIDDAATKNNNRIKARRKHIALEFHAVSASVETTENNAPGAGDLQMQKVNAQEAYEDAELFARSIATLAKKPFKKGGEKEKIKKMQKQMKDNPGELLSVKSVSSEDKKFESNFFSASTSDDISDAPSNTRLLH